MSEQPQENVSRFEEQWSVPLAIAYVGVLFFALSIILGNVPLFFASLIIMGSGSIVHIKARRLASAGLSEPIDHPDSR